MFFCIKSEKGFTLVELLAASALAGLLFASAFGLYSFGVRAYQNTLRRADLQQNVRIAADYIVREIRFASDLSMVAPGEIRYFRPGDQKSYSIKKKNEEIVALINNVEGKIAYDIEELFFELEPETGLLRFQIKGASGEQEYTVKSAVYLRNS